MFNVPILFIIYNRPELTQKAFDVVKNICPKRLFIAADGPRKSIEAEADKCIKTRNIVNKIDWECDVKRLFRDENLGCKRAVSSAISWFFQNVEEGIILEDDCIAEKSFFKFCEVLLEKYRNDSRIMHICGDNFQFGRKRGDGSYYFSRYSYIWGWATWRRAWQYYDAEMKDFPVFVTQNQINNIWQDITMQRFWLGIFKNVYDGKIDTWDYQWIYTVWKQNGLSIYPNTNLVSNIGFSAGATHTHDKCSHVANLPRNKIDDIRHPSFMLQDYPADEYLFYSHFYLSFGQKLKARLRKLLSKIFNIFKGVK